MLAAQRQRLICQLVTERGAVAIAEFAAELGVSRETVRRDLHELSGAGRITRIRGGAADRDWPSVGRTHEVLDARPGGRSSRVKAVVAQTAALLVKPGQTVALSAGTTTREVARALAGVPDLTIVTNSLPAARVLRATSASLQLVLTGGVPGIVGALLGPIAVNTVRGLNVDWLFLGTNGVDGSAGITAYDLGEVELHREWVNHARRVAVVTDHSKWGTAALRTVLPLRDVAALVTDDGLPEQAQQLLHGQVRRLLLAPASR
jgi:DeoR/GlpR family transcriptional regulator of sugar metabolism